MQYVHIAYAVAVGVLLAAVNVINAVVACVTHAVPILVSLQRVGRADAIVAAVVDAVSILVKANWLAVLYPHHRGLQVRASGDCAHHDEMAKKQ
jgi:hypothetical protein